MARVEIEVRGQKLECSNFTLEHAMFFGTLLMSQEELHVYINEEDPDKAFKMMNDRLSSFVETLKARLAGSENLDKLIDDEVIALFAKRMLVRINQNSVPGALITDIRYEVAKRLQEVFPLINRSWVSNTAINLEPSELIATVAMPLFYYMALEAKKQETPKGAETEISEPVQSTQPVEPAQLSTAGKGFAKPEIKSTPPVFPQGLVEAEPVQAQAPIAQVEATPTLQTETQSETPPNPPVVAMPEVAMPEAVREYLNLHPEILRSGQTGTTILENA